MTLLLPVEERFKPLLDRAVSRYELRPVFFTGIGAILVIGLVVLPTFLPSSWVGKSVLAAAAFLAILFTFVGTWLSERRRKTVRDLEQVIRNHEVRQSRALAALESAVHSVGRSLLKECAVGQPNETRLSVYQHEPEQRLFIPIGRVSPNPVLEVSGRSAYADDKGIISQAWERGAASKLDLAEDRISWNEEQERVFDLPANVASTLSMQSRSLVGVRIQLDEHKVGVLVLESTRPRGVAAKHADTISKHEAFGRLAAMLAVAPQIATVTPGPTAEPAR